MKTIFTAFVCLFLGGNTLFSQMVNFFPDEMVVTASSLNLRATPDLGAKKVASLTRGTLVQVVEADKNSEFITLDSVTYGYWLKVRAQGKTGYAFSAYLAGTWNLYYERDIMDVIPEGLQWYGVYARDSFADEMRRVNVRLADEMNEAFGGKVKVLRTNQKENCKFLIATTINLKTGYAGPLGIFDLNTLYFSKSLNPGSQLSMYAGSEATDTLIKPTYGLAATGCARLKEAYVQVTDYQLTLIDYSKEPVGIQDLTPWVKPAEPEVNPSVELLWFGDLDHDNEPDAIIQDCPYEVGCRASLFLSSKAKTGEYIRKVSEHFWQYD